MLGNTQNGGSVKEKNKKLNFFFWFFSGLTVICAVVFVFAAISLLGVIFPGIFGGLWAGISKVPFLADMFGSFLFNLVHVVVMPIVFTFSVHEAKKEIKSHVTDENNHDTVEEVKKVEEVKVINDEDKNKNEMEQNKEKNENHLENKIHENKINQDTNENNNKGNKNNKSKERKPAEEIKVINDEDKNKNEMERNKEKNENHLENKIHENKINQDTNENNNNKGNKNNEVKERKPAKTVGEIADRFLADTLKLMSEGGMRNGEYIIQGPKLLDDWHGMLEHRFSVLPLPMKYPPGVSYCDRERNPDLVSITMQSEHFGHGKLPITIPSKRIKQRLNEIYSMRQKNDGEDEIRQWERQTQERQARDELRKKKQILPQMENFNKNKDENQNIKK